MNREMLATHHPLLATSGLERERVAEEGGELHAVQGEQAHGGRGGGVAARVGGLAAEDFFELRRESRPGAIVC